MGEADAFDDLDAIDGIGPTVVAALVDFFGEDHNLEAVDAPPRPR